MKRKTLLWLLCLSLSLALILVSHAPLFATTFTWGGLPIEGEELTSYNEILLPSGSAEFQISDSVLTIILTNTTSQTIDAIGQVLAGLTWDITTDGDVSLTPGEALIAYGSELVGVGANGDTDLSSEWGFKDDLAAGSSPSGPIGSFGISAVGDVNFVDTFGPGDRFDTESNLFGPGSPGGIDAAIVGPNVDLTGGGFTSQGPLVQDAMIFTFDITGDLVLGEIGNVQPFFGTDGAFLVPEPATMILVGFGLIGLAGLGRKKFFRKS